MTERFVGTAQLMGLIVFDGLLLRSVSYHGRQCSELLGPGDIVRPWDHDGANASIPFHRSWSALERTRLGILDLRFLESLSRWPPLMSALLARAVRRSHWLALQLTISDLRRVDERLVSLFWHAADRWGTVRPDGVHVPLAVTHDVLAQLVAAQRPTVTSALQKLEHEGVVRRLPDRAWLLLEPPPERLGLPIAEQRQRA